MRVADNKNDDRAYDRKVRECPSDRDDNVGDDRIRAGGSPRKHVCRRNGGDPCGAERHSRRRHSARRDSDADRQQSVAAANGPCASNGACTGHRNPCGSNRNDSRRSSCGGRPRDKTTERAQPYGLVEEIVNEGLDACRRPEQYVPRPDRPACGYERDYFDDAADMRNWEEHRAKSRKPKCRRPTGRPAPHSQCLGTCCPTQPEPEHDACERNGAVQLAEHLLMVERLRLELMQRIERQQNMLLSASQRRLLAQRSGGRGQACSPRTPDRSPSGRPSPSHAEQCATPANSHSCRTPVKAQQRRSTRRLISQLLAPKRRPAPASNSQRCRVKYVPPSPTDSGSSDENDCAQSQPPGANSRAAVTPTSTPKKRLVYHPPSVSSSSSSSCGGACGGVRGRTPARPSDSILNPSQGLYNNNDCSWIAPDPGRWRPTNAVRSTSTPRNSLEYNNRGASATDGGRRASSQPSSMDSSIEYYYRSGNNSFGRYSSLRANDSCNCNGGQNC